jgi:predicted ATPase/DNA-binding winged helix-turn-helix (wHTH) protein
LPAVLILNKTEETLRRTVGMLARGDQPVYASDECEIDLARRELRVLGSPVPVGGRAFEILEVLAESAGECVTKDELMNRVWPGAVVMENTLQVHAAAVRKALGPCRGLLKTESGRGYRLLVSWTVQHHGPATPLVAFQQLRGSRHFPATNFPVIDTELIGRSSAVQRLRDLVSAYRVVTLTGPGGIGKTTLALEVAHSLLAEFESGGWLVELASLSDPDLVPSAVAGVLGLKLAGEELSAEAVARAVVDDNLLLILDNCEHLVDAVANLAETFARVCRRATILATSREILRIDGECVYRVPPLEVPTLEQKEPGDILGHSAVELFITRAKALNSDFSPHVKNLPSIAAICRHLDGIPLAIELAAARASALGIEELAVRLNDRFNLLTSGRRTALPRHQTLRATLDWSYELLAEPERVILHRLAIFAGPFSLDAATAVAASPELAASNPIEGLSSLVAKSLVVAEIAGAIARYRLLDTTRAYALARLDECGERERIARRHAEYYQDLFERVEAEWERRPTAGWLADYGPQIDNLRAALDWAFSPGGDATIGVALTAAAVPLWIHLSLLDECRSRTEQALAVLSAGEDRDPRREMKLHAALASSSWWRAAGIYAQGVVHDLGAIWTRALEIAESLGDTEYQLRSLWGLYSFHLGIGQFRVALESAQRFHRLSEKQGQQNDQLIGDRMIGCLQHLLGDQDSARRHTEHMLANFIPPEHRSHDHIRFQYDQRVAAHTMLARVLWLQGFPDQAMRTAKSAVEEARETNHALSLCYALAHAACPTMLWVEDLAAPEADIVMLIDLSTRHALPSWGALGRAFQGVLAIRRGDFDPGLRLLRAGFDEFGGAITDWLSVMFLSELAAGLGSIGQITDGLIAAEQAIGRAEQTEARWLLPESLRIKGELLLLQAADGATVTAEAHFRQALDWARGQGALSWELRAALSYARSQGTQGHHQQAKQILAPVYDQFTEGFETADLRTARAMLDALRS